MWSRRAFGQKLLGALLDRRRRGLLDRMPGMLSAGFIARHGDRMRDGAEGQALVHGNWRPFALDQPFRVASVSKMITATGFMSLRPLDLDTDISTYLGETLRHPAFPDTPITARMLLSHTSGLRNGADFPVPFNRPLLGRLVEAAREENYGGWFAVPAEPPGWFSYSDTNFAVIAQIIERVSGRRFDHFMREALFDRLELDVGYNWSGVSQAKRDRAAAACRMEDGAWTPQVDAAPPRAPEIALYRGENNDAATEADYSVGLNGFAFAPHGGLRLSLNDMDRLAQHVLDAKNHEGNDLTQFVMTTPHWVYNPQEPNGTTERGWYQSYGLGVQAPIGRDVRGASPGDDYFGARNQRWRGHLGDAYGWMTGLFWNSHENRTLVWAINGMPEFDRPPGRRSALSAPEEAVIDFALSH